MKLKGLFAGLFLFILLSSLQAAPFAARTGLVDIPTAHILEHAFLNISYGAQFWTNQGVKGDDFKKLRHEMDLSAHLGLFDRVEFGFSVLSGGFENICGNITVRVFKERDVYPSVAVGMQNISPNQHISSYGVVKRKTPFGYRTIYGTPQYQAFFIVFSKRIIDKYNVKVHLGKGWGRFVGNCEPTSKKLYGIFAGIEAEFFPNFFLKIDENGRDLNIGLQYSLRDIYLSKAWRFLNDLTIGVACMFVEDLFRPNAYPASCYRQPKFGFALTYTVGPIFEPPIPMIEKERLIEEVPPQEEGVTTLEEELLKIREKRRAIEEDIEGLKEKLEKLEKEKEEEEK